MMGDFTVLGAGAMGTAMSYVLAFNGYNVLIWARRKEIADQINHERENSEYMPNVVLPKKVRATTDLKHSVTITDKIVFAVPSHAVQDLCERLGKYKLPKPQWLSVVKGMDIGSSNTISEVLSKKLHIREDSIAVLSGPDFAVEITQNQPTIGIIGCKSNHTASVFRKALTTKYFIIKVTDDVKGVEIGGVLKNVGAIAIGIIDGLNLGDNTRGLIFTRYLQEAFEVGTKVFHAKEDTLLGPAFLGDMIATAFSNKSRNRIIGLLASKTITEIPKHTFIAEGRSNADVLSKLAQKNSVNVPVTQFVDSVLNGTKPYIAFNTLWEKVKKEAERKESLTKPI